MNTRVDIDRGRQIAAYAAGVRKCQTRCNVAGEDGDQG
jgi:hypothetical protein